MRAYWACVAPPSNGFRLQASVKVASTSDKVKGFEATPTGSLFGLTAVTIGE